ncbi:BspA family leucine-rich repeat surface protein [Enterococcus casseliflavus]|uniref:BspA family leucine-rich repeat surface protein n=1 Tax=Enterococcus casseliflavus TaxID=37734 RepID=UPI003DA6B9CB
MILYGGSAGSAFTAPWHRYKEVEHILVEDAVVLSSCSMGLFNHLNRLVTIENANNFDTSHVTDMAAMFISTTRLEKIDVSNWDTSSVTNMRYMFSLNKNLKKIDVNNWDTSNVTNMQGMFQFSGIEYLDVSRWDTFNVTNMESMFSSTPLNYLDISNFDTSNVTNMDRMFLGARNLKNIKMGSHSIFNDSVQLLPISSGQWRLQSGSGHDSDIFYIDSRDFMNNYDGSNPGLYVTGLRSSE